jgi:hypothetical protein
MKCLPIEGRVDVCVSVDVKLIYRTPGRGDLRAELIRKEAQLKARYIGSQQEAAIAETVRQALATEALDAE